MGKSSGDIGANIASEHRLCDGCGGAGGAFGLNKHRLEADNQARSKANWLMSSVEISAVVSLMEAIGGLPLTLIVLLMVIGPWVGFIVYLKVNERGNNKRFEEVVKMYENNVALVKGYDSMSKGLQELVILNTQKLTEAINLIKANHFCPIVRKNQGDGHE